MPIPRSCFNLIVLLLSFIPEALKADSPSILSSESPLESRYQEILEEEREQLRKGEFIEDLASGLAALTIGPRHFLETHL